MDSVMEHGRIRIGYGPGAEVIIPVEVVRGEQDQAAGFSNRAVSATDAMLFSIHPSRPVSFWMKDTISPLDIAYVGVDGEVFMLIENAQPLSTQSWPSQRPVRFVVEVLSGRARALGLIPGARVVSLGPAL